MDFEKKKWNAWKNEKISYNFFFQNRKTHTSIEILSKKELCLEIRYIYLYCPGNPCFALSFWDLQKFLRKLWWRNKKNLSSQSFYNRSAKTSYLELEALGSDLKKLGTLKNLSLDFQVWISLPDRCIERLGWSQFTNNRNFP